MDGTINSTEVLFVISEWRPATTNRNASYDVWISDCIRGPTVDCSAWTCANDRAPSQASTLEAPTMGAMAVTSSKRGVICLKVDRLHSTTAEPRAASQLPVCNRVHKMNERSLFFMIHEETEPASHEVTRREGKSFWC